MAVLQPWYGDPVTQYFGPNEQGIDLGCNYHTDITALFAGTVIEAGRTSWGVNGSKGSSGGEIAIVVNLPGRGIQTSYYLHMDSAAVKVGDKVQQGQFLGLSGGQVGYGNWPVINVGSAIYSTGPHIEFGFNADWVPGTRRQRFDPLPYILAARNGTLPHTSPDGTWTPGGLPTPPVDPGATGATGTGAGKFTPNTIDTAILTYAVTAAQTHKVITQPEGFEGLCIALDRAEQFPPWNNLNPLGSLFASSMAILIRSITILVALFLFNFTVWQQIKGPLLSGVSRAASLASVTGLPGASAVRGITASAAPPPPLAEAPEEVAR